MGNSKKIESLVEQAVGEVLKSVLPSLRQQIVTEVLQAVKAELSAPVAGGTDSHVLADALAAVQTGTTQVQILDAMVDGASNFVARTALFVVRGPNAVGWRARGFDDDDAVRNSPVDLNFGLPAQALQARGLILGPASEFANSFADRFGAPVEHAIVCPLIVRDKVVAIIYADGGTGEHRLDRPALEALIRSAGLWLEVFATRKMSSPPRDHTVDIPVPKSSAASAIAAPTPAPVPAAASSDVAVEPAPEPAPVPVAPPAAEQDEVHKKAKRFAKLLVDEIKLYNQAKVSEGRKHHDLYDRLKEDIEKSRASYDKRYGNTPAKDSDYFNHELVRILADNDPSLFGGNFPR